MIQNICRVFDRIPRGASSIIELDSYATRAIERGSNKERAEERERMR